MSESSAQVDPSEFERLVRDALANLFHQAALASGQPETAQSRSEQLRATVTLLGLPQLLHHGLFSLGEHRLCWTGPIHVMFVLCLV